MLVYNLAYIFSFDQTDIICLSLSREPNAGSKAILRRPRRSQRREEDKRFKPPDLDNFQQDNFFMHVKEAPPDLDQDKHQNISFFMLVKEAPPDAPYKPKPSLNRIGDGSDLRTNPFQVGGDDMNLTSSKQSMNQSLSPKKVLTLNNKDFRRFQEKDLLKSVHMNQRSSNDAILTGADEMDHEPEIDPAPNWQHGDVILRRSRGERPELEHKPKESNRKDKKHGTTWNEPASSTTRSKTRELIETIRGMLQATDPPRARPSPLVLIQA